MKLPKNKDNWYFDGYPRSGNTFSKGLFTYIHPELHGTSHLHTIAGLKIALKRNIRTVIIFRDPLESILSYAFTKSNRNKNSQKYNIKLLEELTKEWVDYYNFSIKNNENIFFVEFKTKSNDILKNLKKIELFLGLNTVQDDKLEEKIFSFQELMKNKEVNKESGYSSLPKKERDEFKKNIKCDLLSLKGYGRAVKIYQKLQKQCNLIS